MRVTPTVPAMPLISPDIMLDRIYEAAVVPEQWEPVLRDFSESIGGWGGFLYTISSQSTHWLATRDSQELYRRFVAEGFGKHNHRIERAIQRGLFGCVVSDLDLFTMDEMARDPMYAFLRAHGIGWFAGCMFAPPHEDSLVISFERPYARGPYEPSNLRIFDQFRPHFARSTLVSARLGLERARGAADAMTAIGLPCAVVSRSKRLVVVNELFNQLIPTQVQDRRERVRLVQESADKKLAETLDALLRQESEKSSSIAVQGQGEQPPFVLHVIPVRRAANDIFSNCSCLLVATAVARAEAPPVLLLQGLFDLTTAEVRLVRGLVNGSTLAALAPQFGVEVSTLRVQLKSVFAKTGLSSQQDLVALLSSVTLPKTGV